MTRRINWGADATDAQYRTGDDDANSRFIVLEDLDGSTVLIERDETGGKIVAREPLDTGANNITTTGTVNAGTVSADLASITKSATVLTNSTSSQSISNSTVTTVEFDTSKYDKLGIADLSNNQVKISDAGRYYISGHIRWSSDSGWSTGDRAAVRSSGANDYGPLYKLKIGTNSQAVTANPIIDDLSSGQTIQLEVFQDSGGSKDLTHSSIAETALVVGRLG